jgi:hypothetical protein
MRITSWVVSVIAAAGVRGCGVSGPQPPADDSGTPSDASIADTADDLADSALMEPWPECRSEAWVNRGANEFCHWFLSCRTDTSPPLSEDFDCEQSVSRSVNYVLSMERENDWGGPRCHGGVVCEWWLVFEGIEDCDDFRHRRQWGLYVGDYRIKPDEPYEIICEVDD